MGKDREGTFHPPKGRPSGLGKIKVFEQQIKIIHDIENHFGVDEKYTIDADEVTSNVRVLHPNRNVDSGEEIQKNRNQYYNNKRLMETFDEERPKTVAEELPQILSKDVFTELANYRSAHCISLYIPSSNSGESINGQADIIAFKNELQSITSELSARQIDQRFIERVLEPGYELLRNDAFWTSLNKGLAVFMADGYFKYLKMPITPMKNILINQSFMISQLVPLMMSKEHFYVLVISKKRAKLFRADAYGMMYIPIEELPNGVDDVVQREEKEDQKLKTGCRGDGTSFHGIGAGKQNEKLNVATYLEDVDDIIWKEILHGENVPLLLAGVEYLIPIYKQVTDYNYIWYDAITGSHEYNDTSSLFEKAREKMEPYFQERLQKSLNNYANQAATELTSSIVEYIVPAAFYGRISHLFVQKDEHIWGSFDEQNSALTVHETKLDEDDCLIDKAVIKTILNGGEVHLLEKDKMPADNKMAALMRY